MVSSSASDQRAPVVKASLVTSSTCLFRARRDAAVAGAERDGLRRDLDRYRAAARTAQDTDGAAAGQAAGDAPNLFADLLTRADDRANQLAAIADLTHAAGSSCERAYDALMARQVSRNP